MKATLFNGLGRYGEALAAAEHASDDMPELFISSWSLAALVEAASRSGDSTRALSALQRLIEDTSVADTDWLLAIAARSQALLIDGDAAELLYREGDRATRPNAASARACMRASPLWRMAPTPASPRRRPQRAAYSPMTCSLKSEWKRSASELVSSSGPQASIRTNGR